VKPSPDRSGPEISAKKVGQRRVFIRGKRLNVLILFLAEFYQGHIINKNVYNIFLV